MSGTLVIAWLSTTYALFKVGQILDNWAERSPDQRKEIAEKLRSRPTLSPAKWLSWIRGTNDVFFLLFDRLYHTNQTRLDRIVWRGILGSYLVLVLARLTLVAFRIPPPPTEQILTTALLITVGSSLLLNAVYIAFDINKLARETRSEVTDFIFSRGAFWLSTCAGAGLGLFVAAATVVGNRMGASPHYLLAYATGTAVATPPLLLLYLIPDRWFPVSPMRTIVFSLASTTILGLCRPDASLSALRDLRHGHWQICTYFCFNLFADAISLIETRWVLRTSRIGSFLGLVALLLIDLILSALIYLVLPGIADQNFSALRQGVLFKGAQPWLGVLFWSTFATSLFFYIFVCAAIPLSFLSRVVAVFRHLDQWFSIYEHPIRLATFSVILVESTIFAGLIMWQLKPW